MFLFSTVCWRWVNRGNNQWRISYTDFKYYPLWVILWWPFIVLSDHRSWHKHAIFHSYEIRLSWRNHRLSCHEMSTSRQNHPRCYDVLCVMLWIIFVIMCFTSIIHSRQRCHAALTVVSWCTVSLVLFVYSHDTLQHLSPITYRTCFEQTTVTT